MRSLTVRNDDVKDSEKIVFRGGNLMGETAASDAAPQHLMALQRANEVRLARADLKRRICSQELSAASVVLECPWEADSMEISDILMSQRRWGRARCRRLLLSLGMPENKQLGAADPAGLQVLAPPLDLLGRLDRQREVVGAAAADLGLLHLRVLHARDHGAGGPYGIAEEEVARIRVVGVDGALDHAHAERVLVEGHRALEDGADQRDV